MMDDEEDGGQVFDGSGRVVRIHRRARKARLAGLYLIMVPAIMAIFIFIGYLRWGATIGESVFVIFVLALYGWGAWVYIARRTRPPCSIDLSRDSISQYEGETLEMEIRFSSTVDVDIVLERYTKDEEYGHLFGYRFSKGEDVINFTAADDWELWDIQAMRGPIFEVVDIHRMRQGTAMKDYREALAGGTPKRHRKA